MGTIDRILSIIEDYFSLREVEIISPFLITPTTIPKSVMQITTDQNKVFYIGFEVRSMGTANYIDIGVPGFINNRLISTNAYLEFDAPKGAYLNANKLMIVSDSADAVIEVSGVYM